MKSVRKAKVVKSDNDSDSDDEFRSCTKCGLKHLPSKCPTYSEVCFKCSKKNHFLRMCGRHAKKGHTRFTKRPVSQMDLTDGNALDMFEYDQESCE